METLHCVFTKEYGNCSVFKDYNAGYYVFTEEISFAKDSNGESYEIKFIDYLKGMQEVAKAPTLSGLRDYKNKLNFESEYQRMYIYDIESILATGEVEYRDISIIGGILKSDNGYILVSAEGLDEETQKAVLGILINHVEDCATVCSQSLMDLWD